MLKISAEADSHACGFLNGKVIIAGCSSRDCGLAYKDVQVIDLETWESNHGDYLNTGRIDSGYGVLNGEFYVFGKRQ